jgi:hypothetical protein
MKTAYSIYKNNLNSFYLANKSLKEFTISSYQVVPAREINAIATINKT